MVIDKHALRRAWAFAQLLPICLSMVPLLTFMLVNTKAGVMVYMTGILFVMPPVLYSLSLVKNIKKFMLEFMPDDYLEEIPFPTFSEHYRGRMKTLIQMVGGVALFHVILAFFS